MSGQEIILSKFEPTSVKMSFEEFFDKTRRHTTMFSLDKMINDIMYNMLNCTDVYQAIEYISKTFDDELITFIIKIFTISKTLKNNDIDIGIITDSIDKHINIITTYKLPINNSLEGSIEEFDTSPQINKRESDDIKISLDIKIPSVEDNNITSTQTKPSYSEIIKSSSNSPNILPTNPPIIISKTTEEHIDYIEKYTGPIESLLTEYNIAIFTVIKEYFKSGLIPFKTVKCRNNGNCSFGSKCTYEHMTVDYDFKDKNVIGIQGYIFKIHFEQIKNLCESKKK